jgi:hypothetical protein
LAKEPTPWESPDTRLRLFFIFHSGEKRDIAFILVEVGYLAIPTASAPWPTALSGEILLLNRDRFQ